MPGISKFLREVGSVLNKIWRTPMAREALHAKGCDDDYFQEGFWLLEIAEARHFDFLNKYDIAHVADAAIDHATQRVDYLFTTCRKAAQKVFNQSCTQRQTLSLDEYKKRSFSGWAEQADTFFSAALQDSFIQQNLADQNITEDQLLEGYAMLQQIIGLKRIYIWETGEIYQAASTRDETLDALDSWLFNFNAIAETALVEFPELLALLKLNTEHRLFQ